MKHLSTHSGLVNRSALAQALHLLRRTGPRLALAAAALVCGTAQAALPAPQIFTLELIYNNNGGGGWTTSTNWVNGGDPCDAAAPWFGVTCELTSPGVHKVVGVNLSANNLNGTLPPLTGLVDVEDLRFSDNRLTGPLPALNTLWQLGSFVANNNQLTGPLPEIAALSHLYQFSVANNQLSGTIPSLAALPAMLNLNLAGNQLQGPIPSLAGMPGLRDFWVANNQLTGAAPDISGLTALRQFYINNNQLTGAAPTVPSPSALIANNSGLCPNHLTPAATPPSANDTAWNTATGSTPWSADCTAAPAPPVSVTDPGVTAVPTLGEWALALLATIMGAMAWARRPRAAPSDASRG